MRHEKEREPMGMMVSDSAVVLLMAYYRLMG